MKRNVFLFFLFLCFVVQGIAQSVTLVVETRDALLIAHSDHAQKVSDVVKMLEEMGRADLL